MRKLMQSMVDGFREQPLALALVLVNVVYLVAGYLIYTSDRDRRTQVIDRLLSECVTMKK